MIINAGADVEGAESSGVIAVLSDQMNKLRGHALAHTVGHLHHHLDWINKSERRTSHGNN